MTTMVIMPMTRPTPDSAVQVKQLRLLGHWSFYLLQDHTSKRKLSSESAWCSKWKMSLLCSSANLRDKKLRTTTCCLDKASLSQREKNKTKTKTCRADYNDGSWIICPVGVLAVLSSTQGLARGGGVGASGHFCSSNADDGGFASGISPADRGEGGGGAGRKTAGRIWTSVLQESGKDKYIKQY